MRAARAGVIGVFRSLRIRNYRLFASGQVVSLTGTWMQRIAQDWLVLSLTDNSGVALGLTTALQFVPVWFFSMYAGVAADRFSKRRLLVVTQLSMCLVGLALGLLDVGGVIVVWHVFVLAALLGVASAFDFPVRQAFVMEMVGRHDVPNAVSLNSATVNLARVIGPAASGFLIGVIGTGPVFLINAASYICVIVSLLMMRDDELFLDVRTRRAPGQLAEGLRYVWSRPDVLLPIVLVGFIATFGMNFHITLALLAKGTFGQDARGYGLLSAAFAVGSLLGALVSARRQTRPRETFLLGAAVAFGTVEMLASVVPTYVTFLMVLIPVGFAALVFANAANTSVQLGAAPHMRGRVMALYILVFSGGNPIGSMVMGWIADVLGPRWSIGVGGFISIAATFATAAIFVARGQLQISARLRPYPRLRIAQARVVNTALFDARSA